MTDRYNVLVCDPPWTYQNKNTGNTLISGSSSKYDVLNYTNLQNLSDYIDAVMDDNSVCFMWATNPLLEDAIDLMVYWGYQYKTTITWIKRNFGLGFWFRGKTEFLLLGIRGKVKPFRSNIPNVIMSEFTVKHSQKPDQSYYLIDKATKDMNPKTLELFARTEYPNWKCIGKQITGNDITTDLKQLYNSLL